MPYYYGEGSSGSEEYFGDAGAEGFNIPANSLFEYVEPWQAKTGIVSFPATPGIEPTIPSPAKYPVPTARPARQGFLARLFGRRQPAAPVPVPTPEQRQDWLARFQEREKASAEHALWKVSTAAARFRAAGVRRVVGKYDGGGDESFTHFHSVEMNDGSKIGYKKIGGSDIGQSGLEFGALIDDAAAAIMGRFDAGEFVLHGLLIIDFDACTITDEKDAAIVFRFEDGDVG